MPKAPLFTDRLKQAAQYAYDFRLSKPYTNLDCPWDWGYPDDTHGPVWRPNHGLAHSARGALYAPTVIEYFRHFAKDKENYQLSNSDIEKIQIALMFRVTGRENESGFGDDPIAYAEYQKNHARYFREYCQANPDIFTDEEVEKFAQVLANYAKPDSLDPISLIFKTCHNLDLLRVRDEFGMQRELKEPTRVLGQDKVEELMHYADSCIRATGGRILVENPIVGKGQNKYDPQLFIPASTNIDSCFNLIASVKPPRPTLGASQDEIPDLPLIPNPDEVQVIAIRPSQKSNHLIANILVNHPSPIDDHILNASDYQIIAATLLKQYHPVEIYKEISKLLGDQTISADERQKIHHNAYLLLKELLKVESPPEKFRPLVKWLSAKSHQERTKYADDNLVREYNILQEYIELDPDLLPGLNKEMELKGIIQKNAAVPDANAQYEHYDSLPKRAVKISLDETNFDSSVNDYYEAIRTKSTFLLSQVRYSDMVSSDIRELHSTKQLLDFSHKLTDSVIAKILTAPTLNEQNDLFDFYFAIMVQAVNRGDYNTAYCILQAFNSPAIGRLDLLKKDMTAPQMGYYARLNLFFNPNSSYVYQEKYQNGEASIPVFSLMISDIEQYSKNTSIRREGPNGEILPNQQQNKLLAERLQIARKYREVAIRAHYPSVVLDVPEIEAQKLIPAHKKMEMSENAFPKKSFVLPATAELQSLLDEENQGKKYFKTQFETLFGLLNSNLELPTAFTVKIGKNEYQSGEKELYMDLLMMTDSIIGQFISEGGKHNAKQMEEAWESMAIWMHAIETHAARNNFHTPVYNQYLSFLKSKIQPHVDISNTENLRERVAQKNKWLEGKPSIYKVSSPMLELGPLPKNESTILLESLVKGMLYNYPYEVHQDPHTQDITIIMGGQEYDLKKIIQNANFNHLSFSDQEKQYYIDSLAQYAGALYHPPFRDGVTVTTASDIDIIDNIFLANDPNLKDQLTQAERMAINIYTTGFYDNANSLLRSGQIRLDAGQDLHQAVWETLCHSAMAISGLNQRSTHAPPISFRGEKNLPQAVLDARLKAAEKKQTTMESSFVSTAKERPAAPFIPKFDSGNSDIAIVFKDVLGIDVQALSAFPTEREFLMPPTQIQWLKKEKLSGGFYLVGRPLVTPQGLTPDALRQQALEESQSYIVENFINNLITAVDYNEFLKAFSRAPKTLIATDKTIIDVFVLGQEVYRILNDPKELNIIINNPLVAIPQLENLGIRAEFGILDNFLKQVNLAYAWHVENTILETTQLKDLVALIESSPDDIGIDKSILQKIHAEMELLTSDPNIIEAIFHANEIPPFMGKMEMEAYPIIKNHFLELAKNAHLQNKVAQTQSIDELLTCLENFEKDYNVKLNVETNDQLKMLANIRNYASDPDMVSNIANSSNSELTLNRSLIPETFGIRAHFVHLISEQYQAQMELEQSHQKVQATTNLEDLISLIKSDQAIFGMSANERTKVLSEIELISSNPDLIEAIFHADDLPFFIGKTEISNYPFLKDHFVSMVKETHIQSIIANTESIEALVDCLAHFHDRFNTTLHSDENDQKIMLDNLIRYANNPGMVRSIAKSKDSPLIFANAQIPLEYGIREQFIQLISQKYQEQQAQEASKPTSQAELEVAFSAAIKKSDSVQALVDIIQNYQDQGLVLPMTKVQSEEMFKVMSQSIKYSRIMQKLSNANSDLPQFNVTKIPVEFGIQAQFLKLVNPESSLRQQHNSDVTSTASIDRLLNISMADIDKFKVAKPKSKTKAIAASFKKKVKISNQLSALDTQYQGICQVFAQIKNNKRMTENEKIDAAFSYLCQVSASNLSGGKPQSSKLEALCQSLKDHLQSGSSRNLENELSKTGKYQSILSKMDIGDQPKPAQLNIKGR